MTGPLEGRTVLVTGAGDGVGRGLAVACGAAGASVVVTSRGENGQETARMVEERGGGARWARCDVTSRRDVEAAVAAAVQGFGGLDVMVHNATSPRSSEVVALEDATEELWEEHASVSLRGAYYCAVAALPQLRERRGRYVLLTSPAGMAGSATLPLYGAVKASVRALAKSLALEWGPLGVNVTCLSPLAMTPALANAYRENPRLEAGLTARIPLGYVGDPELDIGPALVFLASDASRYVTGQTLCVDGGRYLGL